MAVSGADSRHRRAPTCQRMSVFAATLPAMRASRLLSILMLLQSRGRISAPALARRARGLGAHHLPRHRPPQRRRRAGVGRPRPQRRLPAARGLAHAAHRPDRGEAQALFLAGLPGPAKALGLRRRGGVGAPQADRRAAGRLAARCRARRRRASTSIRSTGFAAPRRPTTCEAVPQAVWNEQRLRMRYESWTAVSRARGRPARAGAEGRRLVPGRRASGRELRTYQARGDPDAAALAERFMRPRRFDLAAYWAEATRRFEESVYRGVATLRVSPAGLTRLRRFGPLVAEAARTHRRRCRRARLASGDGADRIGRARGRRDAQARRRGRGDRAAALREALRLRAERLLALYAA